MGGFTIFQSEPMDPSPYGSEAPKEFATKRFKLVWRALLISNLALGAYIFANARKKDMATVENKRAKHGTVNGEGTTSVKVEDTEGAKLRKIEDAEGAKTSKIEDTQGSKTEKEEAKLIPESFALSEFTVSTEEPVFPIVTTQPVKVARKPIPEDEQRELFKWILEEKRKINPKDREEKKRIDEEKAILKQFIRAEKIPKFITDDCFDSSLRDWDKFFSR